MVLFPIQAFSEKDYQPEMSEDSYYEDSGLDNYETEYDDTDSYYEEDISEEESAMTVHPNVIKSIDFYIEKKGETIKGEVTFMDKNENPCLTNGRLSLRWKKRVLTGQDKDNEPTYEYKKGEHIKHIEFTPDDFEGGVLPISLKARKIAEYDLILLEWHGFEVEGEVL